MKKALLFATLFIFLSVGLSKASNVDMFSYDKQALDQEMAELTSLEAIVSQSSGFTMTDLLANGNEVAAKLVDSGNYYDFDLLNEKTLGIGGFWWGCCLGPVGVVIVWLVGEDKDQTKKSLIGCVVASLLGAGSGILSQSLNLYNWY